MCAFVVKLARIRGHLFGFFEPTSRAFENRFQNHDFRRTQFRPPT